jgi:selenocysteine-specific elongation factor
MLEALPGRLAVRVRGLNVHGRLVAAIDAPSRAAVNIGALEPAAVPRGVTIATPGTLALTRHFDARIELLPEAQPLRHGTIARVHQGTAVITGVVSIGALRPRGSEDWTAVPAGTSAVHVEPGDEAYVRVRLHAGAAMTRLDRIVLRGVASATTIGGGVVLDPEPPSGGLRRAGSLERFRQLDGANVEAGLQGGRSAGLLRAAALWIVEASGRCVTAADLVRRGGTDLDTAQRALTLLVEEGRAVPSAQGFVDPGALDGLERRVRAVLEAFHRARPAEAGMPQESLRTQLTPRPAPGLFELGLDRLRMAGFVTGTDRVSLASHKPAVTEADAASRATIEDALRSGGLTPPGIDDIAARCGLPRDAFDRTLRALVSEGVVVKAGPLLLHRDVLARLVEDVRAAGSNAPASAGPGASRPAATIDVAWFKTRFGLSRKFAIPLLEHLDRVRVTRRVGDARLVL